MLRWKFRVYISPSDRSDVQREIDDYDEYATAAFERAVAHLAVTPRVQWQEPQAKKLVNEDPIYEIRFKANQRQTRALGYFDEDSGTFVILCLCFHKGRVYSPPDAFKTAHRRLNQIRNGQATTAPLQINGEDFPEDAE